MPASSRAETARLNPKESRASKTLTSRTSGILGTPFSTIRQTKKQLAYKIYRWKPAAE
jgi:hypothetical protein